MQIDSATPLRVVVTLWPTAGNRCLLTRMKDRASGVYTHRATQEFADSASGRQWKSETDSCFAEERHVGTCLFCNAVYVSIRQAKISVVLDE